MPRLSTPRRAAQPAPSAATRGTRGSFLRRQVRSLGRHAQAAAALLALAVWAAPPLVPEAEAQTTTEVWSTTMTVGGLGSGSLAGFVHSSDTSETSGGSLADDDFDIGGTTYTVWQLYNTTSGDDRLYFRTVMGSPAGATELPDDDELTLQLQSSTDAADFSTYSYRLQSAGWDATNKRYHWSTNIVRANTLPSGQRPSDTLTVKLIRTTTTGPDTTAPRVASIVRGTPVTSPTIADSLTWRVTFSENVQNVDDADFSVSGTTATPAVTEVTASSVYDVTVSGGDLASLDGTVTLSFAGGQNIADNAANALTDTAPTGVNANTYVVDNTAPTVTSIVRQTPSSSPTNADSLTWRFTFSEDLVDAHRLLRHFNVSGTTATLARAAVTASVEDLTASGGDLAGLNATVSLVLDAVRYSTDVRSRDAAGNFLTNAMPTGANENTWVVDNTAPTVAITGVPATSSAPFTATFTFSEAVTDFVAGDITVGNGAASAFTETIAGRVYTASITPAASGTVTVDVAADAATDAAGNGNPAATPATSTYTGPLVDDTAPRVASIVRQTPSSSPTNADSLTWRITFSEDVQNVDAADFAIAGTTATVTDVTVATVSTVYDVTASGGSLAGLDATVTLSIASGRNIADNADNALTNPAPTGTNENTYVVDNTAPTVAITDVPATSSAAFTATFTFSEAVTGFVAGDITVGNGTASAFTATTEGSVYTALITPAASGAVTVDVAADAATDEAGNGNTAATRATSTYTADTTAPRVASIVRQTPSSSPTNADSLTWRITFSEDVQNVDAADFAIAGTTATLTVAEVTASTAYDVTASDGDLAGLDATVTLSVASGRTIADTSDNNLSNPAPTGTNENTYVVDNTAPTVTSIVRRTPTSSPTNADSLTWRVTFSEDVQNVDAADFAIAGTTATVTDVTVATASTAYDVTASDGDLAGLDATVTLSIASGRTIADASDNNLSNPAPTGTNDNTYVVDNTAPTVAITGVPATSSAPFTATFTFSEAVTDFVAGDITVGNGTASAFTATTAGTVFTASITPVASGTVTVDVATDAATDAAGNGNPAATRATSTYTAPVVDDTAPRVASIVRQTPSSSPTNADSLTWRITFSEDVKNVDAADFAIAGTTATLTVAEVTASTAYDVTASDGDLAGLDATVTLSVASGRTIADTSDNNLSNPAPTGTNENTYVVDNTAPTVTSIVRRTPTSSPTNADSLTWRVTFSEDVQNVDAADFAIAGTTATVTDVTVATASTVYDVTASDGDLAGLDATVTLSVASGRTIADNADNALTNPAPTGTNDNTYVVDNTAPTVAITGVPATSNAAFTATFTFSEDVTGFTVDDIDVGNGAASAFTATNEGRVYTALITPAANGAVTVDVAADAATDAAGNGNPAATPATSTYTGPLVDDTAPRVASIVRQTPSSSPTNADSLTWRITFSEDVQNVDAADFAIAGTTATVTDVTEATASMVYDVTASGGNLAGLDATVTLSIAGGRTIADNADNALTNPAPTGTNENTYVVDNTAPTVAITDVPATSSAAFTATFIFSEAVTGFVAGDITVGNGAASAFTATTAGRVYRASITPAVSGTVTVDVAPSAARDTAGNGNTAATRASSTYTAPLVATAPGMPASFTATEGDRQVVLAWTAPVSDGGAAIEKYQFRYSAGSTVGTSAEWADVPDADADSDLADERSVTVGDLDNARQYTFEVRAVNGVRAGAAATARATPVRAPLPPGSGFLVGNFGQPVDRSSQIAVTQDIVGVFTTGARGADLHSIDFRLFTRRPNIGVLPIPSVTLYRASATDNRVTRGARVATLTVAPGSPGSPGSPLPAEVNTARTVAFTAPSGTRLDAGATYLVVLEHTSYVRVESTTYPAEDAGGAPGWAIGGASAGNHSPYSYRTTASLLMRVNGTAAGATVATAPEAPASLGAAAGDARVTLSWTPPESDGGAAVEKYQYRHSAGSRVDPETGWTDVPDGSDSGTSLADERSLGVTGLDNGRQYAFELRAVNAERGGAAATARATPGAPPRSGFLVSNFGRPVDGAAQIYKTKDIVGIFTTGARGATLDSIALRLNSRAPDIAQLPSATLYRASVTHTRATRGTRVATLTAAPGSPRPAARARTVAFTAPPGTRLEAGATYLVVLEASSGHVGVQYTNASAQDAGGAPGWTLDGVGAGNSSPWSYRTSGSLLMSVNGTTAATARQAVRKEAAEEEQEEQEQEEQEQELATSPGPDRGISLSTSSSSAIEGEAVTIGVRRAGPTERKTSVALQVFDSASTGAWSMDLDLSSGVAAATATVPISFDSARPASRTVTVRLASVEEPYSVGSPSSLTFNVIERDAALSVHDARVSEGPGATLAFAVTLDRTRDREVRVKYATADGTATQGEDYTRVSGTLRFAPGETSKTVPVPVLDDAHDEGTETLVLRLSAVRRAVIEDGEATGSIDNSDPLPRAWTVRFGRTVGGQVVDVLTGRLAGGKRSHLTVAGIPLMGTPAPEPEAEADDPFALPAWAANIVREEEARTLTAADLLLRSTFHLRSGGEGPVLTTWGRAVTGRFAAEAADVRLDGDVVTGMVGFDAEWERSLAGVMLSRSTGESSRLDPVAGVGEPGPAGGDSGSIESARTGDGAGTVESDLTGVYPYARADLSDRVSAWGLAGAASGTITLKGAGGRDMKTDLSLRMGALGVKGRVLDGSGPSGVAMSVQSDAMWVGTKSARSNDMVGSEGDVTRLRLIVEGERMFLAGNGATFTPSAEVGLRHDAGDAETGAGLEVGAGVRYALGTLLVEGRARALVAHEASGYEEWGVSGAVRIAPGASGTGLGLRIAPEWGRTGSASQRLWSARDASGLGGGGAFEAESRLSAETGYGFALAHGRGVLTPFGALTLGDAGGRTMRAGARWTLGAGLAATLEATRSESPAAAATNELRLRAALRF